MDNPFSVIGDTMGEALVGAVWGLVVSAIYAVIISSTSIAGWMRLLFIGIFAMVDMASVFAMASEGLNAPVGYVFMRIVGYLLAIMILLQANLSITSAAVNLLVLLGAFALRLYNE